MAVFRHCHYRSSQLLAVNGLTIVRNADFRWFRPRLRIYRLVLLQCTPCNNILSNCAHLPGSCSYPLLVPSFPRSSFRVGDRVHLIEYLGSFQCATPTCRRKGNLAIIVILWVTYRGGSASCMHRMLNIAITMRSLAIS